jgi:hypothetical protein
MRDGMVAPNRKLWVEYQNRCRSTYCLPRSCRPSPKELIVKLAGQFLSAPIIQQDFYDTMQWYDAKLNETRALLEHQADLIRQVAILINTASFLCGCIVPARGNCSGLACTA